MGTKSRSKRDRRRAAAADPIARVMKDWGRDSTVALLYAALSSPAGAHRVPHLTVALERAVRLHPGPVRPTPDDLVHVLGAAREQLSDQLTMLEDWLPGDGRLSVRVRHRGGSFRIHIGDREQPVADVRRVQSIARIVDETLIALNGFGLGDLLEISLRQVDRAMTVMAPHWTQAMPQVTTDDFSISAGEMSAAADVPEHTELTADCVSPTRALKALDWATTKVRDFKVDLNDVQSYVGSALAVEVDRHTHVPLPPPLQQAAICAAAVDLARAAVKRDPRLHQAYRTDSLAQIRKLLPRRDDVRTAVAIDDGAGAIDLLWYASKPRHLVGLQLVSSLEGGDLGSTLVYATKALDALVPGARLQAASMATRVSSEAEILRVIVVATPSYLSLPIREGTVALSLEELEWIAATAEPDDLYFFLRALANPPASRVFSWSAVDVWEFWRTNGKGLIRAGSPINAIGVAPHGGYAEWLLAAGRSGLEEVLHLCGLPEPTQWPVSFITENEARLMNPEANEAWIVSADPVPIAFSIGDPAATPEQLSIIDDLCSGLLQLGTAALLGVQVALESALGGRPLIVRLRWSDGEGPSMRFEGIDAEAGAIDVLWTSSLIDDEIMEPGSAQDAFGQAIGDGVERLAESAAKDGDLFRPAFAQLPRFFAVTAVSAPQTTSPPAPQRIHQSVIFQARRELAQRLHATGEAVGAESRAAATAQATRLAEMVLEMFLERLDRFGTASLLWLSSLQVEAAAAAQFRADASLRAGFRKGVAILDPIARARDEAVDHGRLVRVSSAVLERILLHHPDGTVHADRLDLVELLSIMDEYLDWAHRSEANHKDLVDSIVRIESDFTVRVETSSATRVDLEAWQRARIASWVQSFGGAKDEEDDGASRATDDSATAIDRILDRLGALLYEAEGCTVRDILLVLEGAAGLTPPPGELVAELTVPELIAAVLGDSEVDRRGVERAVGVLTLSGTGLEGEPPEPWESHRRLLRLSTHPLLRVARDRVLVLPWTCGMARLVWIRYVSQGIVPWPHRALSAGLRDGQANLRQQRNRAFEDSVDAAARRQGFLVRSRISKASVIGLAGISGEIDTLAVDIRTGVIWVIEAKDPDEIFGLSEIDNSLNAFHHPTKGYVPKLLAKADDIRQDPDAVAAALGAPARGTWAVTPLMVTSRVEPAAFTQDNPVQFVALADLERDGFPELRHSGLGPIR
jgi:hypothetical protein